MTAFLPSIRQREQTAVLVSVKDKPLHGGPAAHP